MEKRPTRNPDAQFWLRSQFGRKYQRHVLIAVGANYRVEPLNPKKMHHRGRTCVIRELDDDFAADVATVSFTDGLPGSWGKVDLRDLVPLEVSLQEAVAPKG